MAIPRRELLLQKKIVAAINAMGGCVQIRTQTLYTTVGDPDITGCYRRQHVEIEVKVDKEQPTQVQAMRMVKWVNAGALVILARSVKEATDPLKKYVG